MPTGTPKYFRYPFAINGDVATVPDTTQPGGSVSYQQGYGPDYELVSSNPSSLPIARTTFNEVLFDVTSTLQQIYQNGFPIFITSAMNGGAAFSYGQNAYVYQPADGNVYYSLVSSNTTAPPSTSWHIVGGPTATSYFNAATDTGSANHYVIAPIPSIGTPAAGDIVILQPVNANTGACDVNVNGNGAVAIKTLQNQDPAAGMIIPAGTYLLSYNAITGFYVLLNPALGTAAYANIGTANGNVPVLNVTNASAGKIVLGPITIQWGSGTASGSYHGTGAANTFGTAFSGTAYHVNFMSIAASGPGSFTTGIEWTPNVSLITSTGFSAQAPNLPAGSYPMNWFAIGPT